jgi:hypothetical protein
MKYLDYCATITVSSVEVAPEPAVAIEGLSRRLRAEFDRLFRAVGAIGRTLNIRQIRANHCVADIEFAAPDNFRCEDLAKHVQQEVRKEWPSAVVDVYQDGLSSFPTLASMLRKVLKKMPA